MPRPHLHINPPRKSPVSRFSRNGSESVGRGYLVAVTGYTWKLRDVRGFHLGVRSNLARNAPRRPRNSQVDRVVATYRPRNCHEVATSRSMSRKYSCVALTYSLKKKSEFSLYFHSLGSDVSDHFFWSE